MTIDKVLIVLSATSGGICTISSVSIVGAPVGIAGARFTLIFPLTAGIIKKLLSITKNKKKKQDCLGSKYASAMSLWVVMGSTGF